MTATNPNTRNVRIRPVKAFADNYIWLIDDGVNAAVVDPGEAQPVLTALKADGLTLTAILLTHHHQDHVGGVNDLLATCKARVYGPAMETLPVCDEPLGEGQQVQLEAPALTLRVLDVPGHTAGHIAYTGQIENEPVLFCGDTLFVGGCGRLFEGTPAQMLQSLDKFAALAPETRVYCAHEYTLSNLRWACAVEPSNTALSNFMADCQRRRDRDVPTVPSTIATELACNPFMRARVPTVAQAANQFSGQSTTDAVEVFAALRTWKNNFK